jgi:hypothetical protein
MGRKGFGARRRLRVRPARLAVAAAVVAAAAAAAVRAQGGGTGPAPARAAAARRPPAVPWRGAPSRVLPGDVLIADDDNSRLLLVNPQHRIVWRYPTAGRSPSLPFAHPDDAFFAAGYSAVVTNEEDEGTIAILRFRRPRVVWEYGRFGVEGSAPGDLDFPDDAFYDPRRGVVTVADIRNQRILFIDVRTRRIVRRYGRTGVQAADPPYTYGAPNGDFPAPGGGMLVTQIDAHDAVQLDARGRLVRTVPLPGVAYPSDANFTPAGDIIVADYTNPGQVLIVDLRGRVLWRYDVRSGPDMLDQPSLAMQLPNGDVLLNDDGNDRVIVIDPRTDRIVWQYGHTGVPGSAPGYLRNPDGVDFLPAGVVPGSAPLPPDLAGRGGAAPTARSGRSSPPPSRARSGLTRGRPRPRAASSASTRAWAPK